nr:hypothetical protein [Paenibacillus chinjuensis]
MRRPVRSVLIFFLASTQTQTETVTLAATGVFIGMIMGRANGLLKYG